MIDDHIIMLESAKYANRFPNEESNIRSIFKSAFYDGAKWAIEMLENTPTPSKPSKPLEPPVFFISQEDIDNPLL